MLQSEFGRIALADHASTARDEMHGFATDFLALAGAKEHADSVIGHFSERVTVSLP